MSIGAEAANTAISGVAEIRINRSFTLALKARQSRFIIVINVRS